MRDNALFKKIQRSLMAHSRKALENMEWLSANIHPYFFITMKEEVEAIIDLAMRLPKVCNQRKITLVDQENRLIVACLDIPVTLYDTLKTLQEREISYVELTHSYGSVPGAERQLEIQKFEFERKSNDDIAGMHRAKIPRGTKKSVSSPMKRLYPDFEFRELDNMLSLLWFNSESYVRISPHERIVRIIWLYQQGRRHDGLYLDVEKTEYVTRHRETRLLFSVGNPPQRGLIPR